MAPQVPLCSPSVGPLELAAVRRVFDEGTLSHGSDVAAFEQAFAEFLDVPYAVAMNSWTSAAFLALSVLRERCGGGEVLVPSFTFVASANVIVNAGLTPRFVDVDPATGNVTVESLQARLTPQTVGVMPVHFAGRPCEMASIMDWAEHESLFVVEDSAECLGATTAHRQAGSFGIGVFSFYATKNITTGEGGMVTTHDEELATALRARSAHGVVKGSFERAGMTLPWHRNAATPGQNFRLSNLQAALGRVQLDRISELNDARHVVAQRYHERLAGLAAVSLPPVMPYGQHSHQMFVIRVDPRIRDELVLHLNKREVGASVHFDPPVHQQSAYAATEPGLTLPATELLASSCVTLPISPSQTAEQTDYVVDCLLDALV